MAITLLDVVIHTVGKKDSYTGEDFEVANVPMFAGCQICEASLGGHNAYPTKTGYTRCRDCVDSQGFESVSEFIRWENEQ